MKIKLKLLLGFLSIIILMIITGIFGMWVNKNIVNQFKEHVIVDMPVNEAISSMRINAEELIRAVEEYDSLWISKEDMEKTIEEKKERIKGDMDLLLKSRNGQKIESINRQKVLLDEFYNLTAELIEIHDSSREEKTPIMEELDEKVEELDENLDTVLKENMEMLRAKMDNIQKKSSELEMVNILLNALFFVISSLIVFFVSRSILGPVYNLSTAALAMGKGDMSSRASILSKGEVGVLASVFNKMADNIQQSYSDLENKIEERTAELENKLVEVENMNRLMAGRELKMVELKKEIEDLKNKLERKT